MKAAMYEVFGQPITIQEVPDPIPGPDGVVIQVKATGLCRSDWHGWLGHDNDITLPHVPGHELAGEVAAVGQDVRHWRIGDRVTLPFVCGCGRCPQCLSGNHQVCDHQFQPGFTHWGSFAEYVAVHYADVNLVRLPDAIEFETAAALGCRFATSFRALVDQGQVSGGQWVAVHGCGGVGLSAIMIAHALGAQVIAIDITDEKLAFARALGAVAEVNAAETEDIVQAVKKITDGGAHVSIDALGSPTTCFNSISNLRKHGRHVQIGLMVAENRHPVIPMNEVIAYELELYGSHGMPAHNYPALLRMIAAGKLQPQKLIGQIISLAEATTALPAMGSFPGPGITIINQFS